MENNTWGKAVVEKALLYAEHKWYPTDKNVMHGVDENAEKNSFTHDLWHSHWSDDRRKKYR